MPARLRKAGEIREDDFMCLDGMVITAVFEKIRYNLVYSANPGGSVEGETRQTVDYGEDAQSVTAVPDEGYEFLGWSDGVMTATRHDKGVKRYISARANFAPIGQNTFELVMPFVTEVHGEFLNDAGGITQVDYVMTELERKILEKIPDKVSGLLNDAFKGRIKFTVDGCFTENPLGGDDFIRGSHMLNPCYSLSRARCPAEIKEIGDRYHGTLTTYCLNDYETASDLISGAGSAMPRFGEVHTESLFFSYMYCDPPKSEDMAKLLGSTTADDEIWWSDALDTYLHEFAHMVEPSLGKLHVVLHDYFHEHGQIDNMVVEVILPYLTNELIVNGELCGIPYSHWQELMTEKGFI